MCMKVDLPEPDGPVTARNSPVWTSRFTPRSAFTSTSPTTYVLTRLLTEITSDISLPASSAAPTGCATEPSGRSTSALVLLERIAGVVVVLAGLRTNAAKAGHTGHDFSIRLDVAGNQFRVGAVRNSEAYRHGLQLLVDVEPHAAVRRHDRRKRWEECVDGRRRNLAVLRNDGARIGPSAGRLRHRRLE